LKPHDQSLPSDVIPREKNSPPENDFHQPVVVCANEFCTIKSVTNSTINFILWIFFLITGIIIVEAEIYQQQLN
jgi:hypothetical protein